MSALLSVTLTDGLNHAEHKALNSIAVEFEVVHFRSKKFFGNRMMRKEIFEQGAKTVFHFPEIGLIDPKRVVCVERD